ncbi:hypothetical protein NFI96_005206 [Prochilodus magdalenae]|nr:hypothetical protein NFI96_005206 [Prochilodus magdalenae]
MGFQRGGVACQVSTGEHRTVCGRVGGRGLLAAMASEAGVETLSLRHGVRCVPESGTTVEDVLLAVGEQVGCEHIYSASRMNKAVVVFLEKESFVNSLIESGVWVKGVLVQRVVISNVPPFIKNEAIMKELARFGKFASAMKMIPLGSFDKQADQQAGSSGGSVGEAAAASGPDRRSAPACTAGGDGVTGPCAELITDISNKDVGVASDSVCNKQNNSPSTDAVEPSAEIFRKAVCKTDRPVSEDAGPALEQLVGEKGGVHECTGDVEEAEAEADSEVESVLSDCSGLSEIPASLPGQPALSDCTSQPGTSAGMPGLAGDVYPLSEIDSFLRATKGKRNVSLSSFFPDSQKFIRSVQHANKSETLKETHSDEEDEVQWRMWWKGPVFLSNGTNVSAGLAILVSPGLSFNIISQKDVCSGRLFILHASIYEQQFILVNVYAPNTGRDRAAMFTTLRTELSQYDQDAILILGGDWNCTLDFTMDRTGDEPHMLSANVLKGVVMDNDLVDCWRIKHPSLKQFTWLKTVDGRMSAARLDRFYIPAPHCNRLVCAQVVPVSFSDHSAAVIHLAISAEYRKAAYWKFNVRLLQDAAFCSSFQTFWARWSERKAGFGSLRQWWDVGKAQIRLFCQQYTAYTTSESKRALATIERSMAQLQQQIAGHHCEGLQAELEELHHDLGSFFSDRARGALVRARFQTLREMDAPSSFFFNLEKKCGEAKRMHALYMSNGRLSSDTGEVRDRAVEFYSDLYKAESCDDACVDTLMADLPKLTVGDVDSLDLPLTLDELKTAVSQMAPGRAPGIDGLPVEFYKTFWEQIGHDLFLMLTECIQGGGLPLSCRRAVLTLLPKKGDLCDLKNWRPLALLCTDYKIFSKALANRLKGVLGSIVHRDQAYCVTGRSITDNLFLIRDVMELANRAPTDLGLISLDQEKAFDRVDHGYLFKTLATFGFGERFMKSVKLLYTGASCVVKVRGGLAGPIELGRGVRQGCAISGQLYALFHRAVTTANTEEGQRAAHPWGTECHCNSLCRRCVRICTGQDGRMRIRGVSADVQGCIVCKGELGEECRFALRSMERH